MTLSSLRMERSGRSWIPWIWRVWEPVGESLVPIEVLASQGDRTPIVKAMASSTDGSTWLVVHQPGEARGGFYILAPEAASPDE